MKSPLTLRHLLACLAVTAGFLAFCPSTAMAQDVTLSSNTTWSSNMSVNGTLTLNNGVVLTLTGGADVTATNLVMGSSARIQISATGSQIRVSGNANMGTSSRIDGSEVNISGGSWTMGSSAHIDGNVQMSVANLTTSSSAYFDANGRGHGQNAGPGRGYSNGRAYTSGSGASHGGSGRPGYQTGSVRAYHGSALRPTEKGSGGGSSWCASAGTGGGVIRLEVSGRFQHDGYLRANGHNGANSSCHGWRGAGGGAGGSIWVTTSTLAGSAGRFYAYGGNGGGGHNSYRGGGGGGGRIAVYYRNGGLGAPQNSEVQGGYGYQGYAQRGTLVFIKEEGTPGDTRDDTMYVYRNFRFENGDGPFRYRALHVYNSATVVGPIKNGEVMEFTDVVMGSSSDWNHTTQALALTSRNVTLNSSSKIRGNSITLALSGNLRMEGGSLIDGPTVRVTGTSTAVLNSSARIASNDVQWSGNNLSLTSSSGTIDVSARGPGQNAGTGAGYSNGRSYCSGSGASHGGQGRPGYCTSSVRKYYGSGVQPTTAGSGGGSSWCANGGRGGGVVRINLSGTFNNVGNVYANGGNGANSGCHGWRGAGGGSGGSIWVTTDTLAGSGRFTANGGRGGGGHGSYQGGGGGGGRIAVHYDNGGMSSPTRSTVAGGSGYGTAGAGTLVFIDTEGTDSKADDSYVAYQGFRFESTDAPYRIRNFRAYNSTAVSGPDAADMVLEVSNQFDLLTSATWRPNQFDTVLTTQNYIQNSSSNTHSGTKTLRLNVNGTLRVDRTSYINARVLTVRGTSTADFVSTGKVEADRVDWQGNSLTLSSSAQFNVSGRGYTQNGGPSPGVSNGRSYCSGSGATHGGKGRPGYCTSTVRDPSGTARSPNLPGSGGGSSWCAAGGRGGGVIRVQLTGTMAINGYMYADGRNGANSSCHGWRGAGGGAGGSIWVTTDTLAGSGRFQALGGNGGGGHNSYRGGSGGGGRIYVDYARTSSFSNPRLSSVRGGYGYGGAYAESGTLAFFDRTNDDIHVVEGWRWQQNDGAQNYRNLSITDSTRDTSAHVRDDGQPKTINVSGTLSLDSSAGWAFAANTTINAGSLTMASSATISGARNLTISVADGASLTTSTISAGALRITGDGDWTLGSSSRLTSSDIFLDDIGTVTLNSGANLLGNIRGEVANLRLTRSNAYLSADGYGHAQNAGPGAGYSNGRSYCSGSGGSHGGRGNAGYCTSSRRDYYDKAKRPTEKGSGGGSSWGASGGAGGGVIKLVVNGELRNTGLITVSGRNGATSSHHGWRGAGGGAGGTIQVDTNTLTGTGYFRANGGNGGGGHNSYRGGGGGGGRISVYFNSWSLSTPHTSTVLGGSGYAGRAEVGTLAFIHRGDDSNALTDDTYHTYQGWRWQSNDGEHVHKAMDAYNSTLVRGPDSNGQVLRFSEAYRLRSSARWVPNTHDALLTTRDLTLDSSANIHASSRNLRMAISGTGTQGTSSYLNANTVTVTGTSSYTMGSGAYVSSRNIQWAGRNLHLSSSSANFNVSGRGEAQNAGPGKGVSNGRSYCSGSGGSSGGQGGTGYCTGGRGTYNGSAKQPVLMGSGGGSSWCAAGGAGGGIIRVNLTGQLYLTGRMYADGANGATSSCHGWRGAGGGAGGSIWVTTDRIRGGGSFRAYGGTGGGGHNSYRGGGGGGGRIFVTYNDDTGFTTPRYSSVRGGYGYGGRYADNGTMAFHERDVNDLWVVEGWRWQQNDGAHTYNNLKITDSTTDSSAWVRDDGNATRIDVVLTTSMDASSYWQTTAGLTDLRTTNLTMSNARIAGQPVSITVGGNATLASSSRVETTSIRAGGTGNWTFNSSSRFESPAIVFNQVGNVTLNSGAYLKGNVSGTMRNLSLTTTSASINATGYGYGQNAGPGAGYANNGSYNSGSGGSHGGVGRAGYHTSSVRSFYGDLMAPTSKGSGGGSSWGANAGAGGGVIDLVVIDEFRNSGYFYADGANGQNSRHHGWRGAGGGAGGSILVDAGTYSGTGYMYARGGTGGGGHNSYRGGGGGGGRIMVRYNTSNHTRRHYLYPTGGYGYGGAYAGVGTAALYDKTNDKLFVYGGWRWEQASRPFHFKGFEAYNSTAVTTQGSAMEVQVDGDCYLRGSAQWDSSATDLSLDCFNMQLDSGSRIDAGGKTLTTTATGTVDLHGNAWMRGRVFSMLGAATINLNSTARFIGNLNIQGTSLIVGSSAQLTAAGYGYGQNAGPGRGQSNGSAYRSGAGGGHGGSGGVGYGSPNPGQAYGSTERPVTPGSGGGSSWCAAAGAGGGTIHVVMIDRFQVDGQVYAQGGNGANSSCHGWRGAGGGAGGSILVEAANFTGRGRLYARGGNGGGGHNSYRGGAGGGGRIATCVLNGGFIGQRDVAGGYGYAARYGQTGSVYDQCSPVLPEAAVVVSRGANSPAGAQHAPETAGVVVAQWRLREVTRRKAVTVKTFTLKGAGSLNEQTHITAVKLYVDTNANGTVDEGETLVGTGTYNANDGTVTYSNINIPIEAGGAVHVLATYDLGANIPNNLSFATQIQRPDSLRIYTQDTDAEIPMYGAPVVGATHRIWLTPPPIVSYVSPSTVWQGADSSITLYGNYFTGATRVDVTDSNSTQLTITNIYRSGTRMTVRVPSNILLGRHHIRVTTPHGRNARSAVLLTVQASCNTGLHGICAAGITQGQDCVPRIRPGQRNEVCSNGVDEDCNGADLDCRDVDGDGDGFTPNDGDCNDNDGDIFPRDGLGCSGGRDDLNVRGVARAVVTYTPLADGDDTSWTSDVSKSWYQAAAGTIVNSAASFPSAEDYARIPDSIYLQPSGDKMSIGSWIKMDEVPEDGQYAIFAKGPRGAETFLLYWDGAHSCWVAVVQTVNGRFTARAARTLRAGTWVHMGLTYDGGQWRIHENGAVIASVGATGNILHNDGAVHLGGNIPGYQGLYRSYIDEFTFFGRAVTAAEWSAAVGSNRTHKHHAWGNSGPVIRFGYDFGPGEYNRRIGGSTFHGKCRITGRSSQPAFPTFCSVVGTSTGFDIWDEPSGELWARYYGPGIISGSGIDLDSVDYVAAAGGRIYLGSHTDGGNGIVVIDYANDRVEHWSTSGVRRYNGGVGAINASAGYGTVNGSGLRLPNNRIRRLRGWARNGAPYIGVACDEGVWVVEGRQSPFLSAGYFPRYDQRNQAARERFALLNGCGVHPVGDKFYFGMNHTDRPDWDIITAHSYRFEGVDVNTPIADLGQTMAPSTGTFVYGRRDGNDIFGSVVRNNVNWGGVRDIVIMPNRSRHPDANGDDHLIAMGTPEGVVLIDQADSSGVNPAFNMVTLKSGEGEDTDTEKYVLFGDANDTQALGVRGGELFVGTTGGGVSRLALSDEGVFSQLEHYSTDTDIALPSNNVTALSCGKNALVATDEGVASIRYPDPGPCTVEGAVGACAAGTRLLVNNALRCVQTTFPSGEACDDVDNDCDGQTDEHPREGSICDAQDPAFEPIDDISVTTRECNGAEVLIPTPRCSDGQDDPDDLVITSNAPARFQFGRTTVLWQAKDTDDNTATAAHIVTVAYDGQPTLEVPEDVTAEAQSPNGTAVNLGTPSGEICVPGGVQFSHDGPARYPVGTTTVTWTARGQQGRPTTGTQRVVITDNEPPTIEVGADRTFDFEGNIVLPTPAVSDNGTPTNQIVVTNNAPDSYPIQEWVTITFTARDQAGNTATDSMRVFVQSRDTPPPTLTIAQPSERWHSPPVSLAASVVDGNCEIAPRVTVNSEDLSFQVRQIAPGRFAVSSNRVSDGLHRLTTTATSGCSNKASNATRTFGVDSGGQTVVFNGMSQDGVDPGEPGTWPGFSNRGEISMQTLVRDDSSGLASVSAEIVNMNDDEETVALHAQTFDQRNGVPETGVRSAAVTFCSHDTYCNDGKLKFDALEGTSYVLRIKITDVAGNELVAPYYFKSLGLREAIIAWADSVRAYTTESEQAAALLDRIEVLLGRAVGGYDAGIYGNTWLALEDAFALVIQARVYDGEVPFQADARLVARLAADFQQAETQSDINEHGDDDNFAEANRFIGLARQHEEGNSPGDAFLSLANSYFWQLVGVDPMAVALDPGLVAYRQAKGVLDRILVQMNAYVEVDPALGGRSDLVTSIENLTEVQTYFADILEDGDLAQSDLRHVQMLLHLTNTAERLKAAENETAWVRNWQYGLSQITALYSYRALVNAETWIGRNNPLWTRAQARFTAAESYRENKRADDYMSLLINSRCLLIGVYNGIYNPDVEVPQACCAEMRELHALEARVPLPDQCLAPVQITIRNGEVSPATIHVKVGQVVRWLNSTDGAQTVIGGVPGTERRDLLESPALAPNAVYTRTFDRAGTLPYFIGQNDRVRGSIVVSE